MNALLVLVITVVGVALCAPFHERCIPSDPSDGFRSNVRDEHGQFAFEYQAPNGTFVQEQGTLKRNQNGTDNVLVKKGSYSYTSPEGVQIELSYRADENGFQPIGKHIPVPPVTV